MVPGQGQGAAHRQARRRDAGERLAPRCPTCGRGRPPSASSRRCSRSGTSTSTCRRARRRRTGRPRASPWRPAIVSVLTGIPVRRDVAMTGEITLRGRVLPIGGLKEKLLAALRAGITTVFIPKENEKDLAEIPDNVKKGLTIIPVTHVDEVIAKALVAPAGGDQLGGAAGDRRRRARRTDGAPSARTDRTAGRAAALRGGRRPSALRRSDAGPCPWRPARTAPQASRKMADFRVNPAVRTIDAREIRAPTVCASARPGLVRLAAARCQEEGGFRMNKQDLSPVVAEAGDLPKAKAGECRERCSRRSRRR